MKVVIRDPETLELLRPSDIELYLRANHWERLKRVPGEYASWEYRAPSKSPRKVLVPLDHEFGDYAQRIAEMLSIVAEAEERSQLAVYEDISRVGVDGIAVRSAHPNASDGSIPVHEGARLVENTIELVEAAACSTVESKRYFSARRPKQANEYTSLLRMGQTSRGSYIVNLYSPLRIPSDSEPSTRLISNDPDELSTGFGRKAVLTLARALQATTHAIEKPSATENTGAFLEAVQEGVSANLLGAVSGLFGEETPRVEVAIRWSPSAKPPKATPSFFTFERSHLEHIERAEELLRPRTLSDEEIILRGHVIQLNRRSDLFQDRIFLQTSINERETRVAVVLANEDYRKAIKAFEQRKELQCRGDLVKVGRSYQYRLDNPKDVEIVS